MKKNKVFIVVIVALVLALVVSVWQNVENAFEQDRIRRNMINHAYSELNHISLNLNGLIKNIESRTTSYETNQQSLIMISTSFTRLDTILKWYATIYPYSGTRNGYPGGIFNFEFISYTLTSGTGTANDMPYSGISADGFISDDEVRYLTILRDDVDVIIDAMVSPTNPPQENNNLTSSQIDDILETFFSKWTFHNENSPYFLLRSKQADGKNAEMLVGSWSSETGSITHLFGDGTGRTEDNAGIHEFTWESISLSSAIERVGVRIREYIRVVYGEEYTNTIRDADWGKDDYLLLLNFDGVPFPLDFPYTLEGDTLTINTMSFGQILSPTQNLPIRLTWVALTKTG